MFFSIFRPAKSGGKGVFVIILAGGGRDRKNGKVRGQSKTLVSNIHTCHVQALHVPK